MMSNFLKRLLYFVIFFFCTTIQLIAQDKFEIFGKVTIENGTIDDTYITIFENAVKKRTIAVDKSGKFSFSLNFGNDYQFEFSKEGFVTKKVSVSTFVPVEVLEQDSQFPPFKFGVSLFPTYEGLDLSIFDQPLGIIMYDKEMDQFDKDPEYDAQIRDAIRKAEEEARKRAKEEEAKRLAMERAYQNAITKGDENFKVEKYRDARLAYNEAIAIKEKAKYPRQQIQKIDELLSANKELEEKYTGLILQADVLFKEKDYSNAKLRYEEALQVKKQESYPKSQIQKIVDIIAEQKRKEAEAERVALEKQEIEHKYTVAIQVGDKKFKEGDFDSAKTAYLQALTLKKDEMYPRQQIQVIAQLEREDKALNEKYRALIKEADGEFSAKDYLLAKESYTKALALKKTEIYPQQRIKKIEEILAEQQRKEEEAAQLAAKQKALDDQYDGLITKANSEFDEKDYVTARTTYEQALLLKNKEAYPQQRIKEIDQIFVEEKRKVVEAKRLAAEQKAKDEKYKGLLAKADLDFNAKNYSKARIIYEKALALKENEVYPKEKIAEIDKIVIEEKQKAAEAKRLAAEQKALDRKYKGILEKADREFSSKKYEQARLIYQEALALKASEIYPKQKIEKIDQLLAEQKQKEEAAAKLAAERKKLDDQYNALITKADGEMDAQNYEQASVTYQEALQLKSTEVYPKQKIKKIKEIIAAQKKKEAEKARLAARQKIIDDRYNTIITKADQEFTSKDYITARISYNKALALKENEIYPKEQIQKINEILAEKERKEKEAAKLAAEKKKLDDKYKAIIVKADRDFTAKNYDAAKANYVAALEVKANEIYPQEKITKIDELIAEQKRKDEEAALLAAEEKRKAEAAAELAAEQKALDDQYRNVIAKADKEFAKKNYTKSREHYQEALSVKAEETYPKERMAKIDEIFAEQKRKAEEVAKIAAQQKELESQYIAAIKQADEKFKSESFEESKLLYKQALSLKPTEKYPKKQLKKIEIQLAEKKRILAQEEAKNERYRRLIAEADDKFEKKSYRSALYSYKDALKIKSEEKYPQDKIVEIQKILEKEEQEKQQELALKQKAKNISKAADKLLIQKDYQQAKAKYQESLDIYYSKYAKDQIDRVDVLLANLDLVNQKKKKLDEEFKEELDKAEEHFGKEEYGIARHHFKAASKLKPQEEYPKKKLREITKLLEGLKKSEEEFVAKNPKNFETKLSIVQERKYADLIKDGDENFKKEDFGVARVFFERALELFNRDYPKKRLKDIDEKILEKKNSKILKEYKEMIAKGDRELSSKNYSVAKFYYKKAIGLNSAGKYPRNQVKEIQKILQSNKNAKVKKEYDLQIAKGDAAFNKGNLTVARFYYKKANELMPGEKYPKEKLKIIQSKQSKN